MEKNKFSTASFNDVVQSALNEVKKDSKFINELKQISNESRNPNNAISKAYNETYAEHKRKGWIP